MDGVDGQEIFVPPEDARLLRETVRQDSFRLLAGDDINRSSTADILDYLRGISWDQVGVGAECVSPIFVLTSERQVKQVQSQPYHSCAISLSVLGFVFSSQLSWLGI